MSAAARYVLACLCVCVHVVQAQETVDSVRVLKEVVLQQSRLDDYAITGIRTELDSLTFDIHAGKTLTELLQATGLGMIRSYSPGGIATATFHGTGSSHTSMLWHGINIGSPMNGQFDLSLVPIDLFNYASIQSGGNSSLFGSGSVGGTIQLRQNPQFDQGILFKGAFTAGSFGKTGGSGQAGYSTDRIALNAGIIHRTAMNDFTYPDAISGEPVRWKHSHQALTGVNQSLDFQLSDQHYFYTRFWFQRSTTQVPNPSTVIRQGTANQNEQSFRNLLGYIYTLKNVEFHYQAAYLNDRLYFLDDLVVSRNHSESLVQHLESTFQVNEGSRITTGIRYIGEKGRAENYGEQNQKRNRTIISGAYVSHPGSFWTVSLAAREEIVDGKAAPFAPSIAIRKRFFQHFSTEISIQRNYRIPTFNDLYWSGAGARGNPDLLTEISSGGEVGFYLTIDRLNLQISGYSNWINNWIQWVPVDSRTWSPENIKQVWSRGIETNATYSFPVSTIDLFINGSYRFTRSTNSNIYHESGGQVLNKQLILTPVHSGSFGVTATYKKLVIQWSNVLTGKRYGDSDNTQHNALEPFFLSDINFSWQVVFKRTILGLTASVNNIFNTTYVARPGYPMPGRNVTSGLSFKFN